MSSIQNPSSDAGTKAWFARMSKTYAPIPAPETEQASGNQSESIVNKRITWPSEEEEFEEEEQRLSKFTRLATRPLPEECKDFGQWRGVCEDLSSQGAAQTNVKPLESDPIPSADFNIDEVDAMFDIQEYCRYPTPQPKPTYAAMDIDSPNHSPTQSVTNSMTTDIAHTSVSTDRLASAISSRAPTTPKHHSPSRSSSQGGSNDLGSPYTKQQLADLAELTDPKMRSFLAYQNAKSGSRQTDYKTRQSTANDKSVKLKQSALAARDKRMMKELDIPLEDVEATLRSYPSPRR